MPGESDPLVQLNRAFGSLLQQLSSLPQLLVAAVQVPPWAVA